jgi:hypothetical protein
MCALKPCLDIDRPARQSAIPKPFQTLPCLSGLAGEVQSHIILCKESVQATASELRSILKLPGMVVEEFHQSHSPTLGRRPIRGRQSRGNQGHTHHIVTHLVNTERFVYPRSSVIQFLSGLEEA